MADVDFTPGGSTSGFLGGGKGDGGGGGGGRRPEKKKDASKGHYAEGKASVRRELMTFKFAKKFRRNNYWVKYILDHPSDYPTRRPISFRANRGLPFDRHESYGDAAVLTVKGEVLGNGERCTNCGVDNRKNTGTFQLCVAFPKGQTYPELGQGQTPFNGACSNCVWGGQASTCTLREGGATDPPGKRPATAATSVADVTQAGSSAAAQQLSSVPAVNESNKIKTGQDVVVKVEDSTVEEESKGAGDVNKDSDSGPDIKEEDEN